MDAISLKQEQKIKNLEEELSIYSKESKEKDNRYKKLDEIYISAIKVIEEHKKIIQNLKNKIKAKESEEKNKKLIVFQKDQEILLLRNFINSYKADIKNKYRSGGDNVRSKIMNENNYKQRELHNLNKNKSSLNISKGGFNNKLNKFNNAQNNNKNFLPKVEVKKNNKIFTDSNYLKKNYLYDEIKDKEDENFKEITNLMKKMINE